MLYNLEAISHVFALESAAARKLRAKFETGIYLMSVFTLHCSITMFFSLFHFFLCNLFSHSMPPPKPCLRTVTFTARFESGHGLWKSQAHHSVHHSAALPGQMHGVKNLPISEWFLLLHFSRLYEFNRAQLCTKLKHYLVLRRYLHCTRNH